MRPKLCKMVTVVFAICEKSIKNTKIVEIFVNGMPHSDFTRKPAAWHVLVCMQP